MVVRLLTVVSDEGKSLHLSSVERSNARFRKRTHADNVRASVPQGLLVAASALEKRATNHRVDALCYTAAVVRSGSLEATLRENILRRTELTGKKRHLWGEESHEPVDEHEVTNIDTRVRQGPGSASDDELSYSHLHQGFDLKPNHLVHHGICGCLVDVNATVQSNHLLPETTPCHELAFVPLKKTKLFEARHPFERDLPPVI